MRVPPPDVAVHYVRWGEDPAISQKLATGMISDAASPLLELAPYGTTLTAITAGHDDRWLRTVAVNKTSYLPKPKDLTPVSDTIGRLFAAAAS